MRKADDEELSFVTLAAATANVVRYLELDNQHHSDGNRDGAENGEKQKKNTEREQYVSQREKELARFEQRYSENKKQSSR